MLPKRRRIQRSEFISILSKGNRYNSPHFLLYLVKNQENKPFFDSKIAFSVSKKVCPKAVDRNRLRRKGYSIISKNLKYTGQNLLFLFVFKKGSASLPSDQLEKEIHTLLSNALVII